MSSHPQVSPISDGRAFLTDGGLETTLVFQEGLELPHFAAFPLVDTAHGRAALRRCYEKYLALAAERELGFILDTPTWRANPDWGAALGYSFQDLDRVNRDCVDFVSDLRAEWQRPGLPILLDGVIGPRGDGYKDGSMDPHEAEDYHAVQIDAFLDKVLDLVSAITMTGVGEAVGIARAAKARGLPHVISFTVETDGRLVGGTSLRAAIEATDEATGGSPLHYMVNCAHPTHFEGALGREGEWVGRIGGLRANASRLSHAALNGATELDAGDPIDLGHRYRALRPAFPAIRVLGGCCGTDHRHVEAIRDACLPAA